MKTIRKRVVSVKALFMVIAMAVTFVFPQTVHANDADDLWEMYLENPLPVKMGTVYEAKFSNPESDESRHITFESAGGTYTITLYCKTIMNPLESQRFDHYQLPILFEGLITSDGSQVISGDAEESSGPILYTQEQENGWYKCTDTVGSFTEGTLVAVDLKNNPIKTGYGIKGENPYTGEYKVVINGNAPAADAADNAAVKAADGSTVKVTSNSANTVAYTKAKNAKSVTVPASVSLNGKTYKVTEISANAFKGTKATTVTIGKNVKTIKAKAFNGSKVTTLNVKSKSLTKKSVKGSLKGSKVRTVKVKVGSKAQNKKFVKKYKKIFTKVNAGKKVTIK